jgi:hypothetical protein
MNNQNQDFPLDGIELVNAFGWLYGWESVTLSVFVKGMLPHNAKIVNIGAGVGTSSLSMVLANPMIDITTVDISAGGPYGGLENERNAFKKSPLLRLPKQVQGDSSAIGKNWKGGDLDLVLVDGDHSRDGLSKDIDAWYPHVKAGGYIAFHDYQAVLWGDVKTLIDERMQADEKVLHIDTLIIFRKYAAKPCECKHEAVKVYDNTQKVENEAKISGKKVIKKV